MMEKVIAGFSGTLSAELFLATAVIREGEILEAVLSPQDIFYRAGGNSRYGSAEILDMEQDGFLTLFSEETLKEHEKILTLSPRAPVPSLLLSARSLKEFYAVKPYPDWNPDWQEIDDIPFVFALVDAEDARTWLLEQAEWFMTLARREMAKLPFEDKDASGASRLMSFLVSGDAARRRRFAAERFTEWALLGAKTPEVKREVLALRALIVGCDPTDGAERMNMARKNMISFLPKEGPDPADIDEAIAAQKDAIVAEKELQSCFSELDLEILIDAGRERTGSLPEIEQPLQARYEAQRFYPLDGMEKDELQREMINWAASGTSVMKLTYPQAKIIASEPDIYTLPRPKDEAAEMKIIERSGPKVPKKGTLPDYLLFPTALNAVLRGGKSARSAK